MYYIMKAVKLISFFPGDYNNLLNWYFVMYTVLNIIVSILGNQQYFFQIILLIIAADF